MTPSDYFATLKKSFFTSSQPLKKRVDTGGEPLDLYFQNQRSYSLFPDSFLPSCQAKESALSVYIFDGIQENVRPVWSDDSYGKKGEISGYNEGSYRLVYDIGARALSMIDLEAMEAIFWVHDVASIPYWERGAPLRNLLHWYLPTKGKYLIHAASVGDRSGSVLIIGKGGTGKSTTALSCLNSPLSYLSDDYCVVKSDPIAESFSAFTTAKIDPKGAHKLQLKIENCSDEKVIFKVEAQKMVTRSPLKAIFFPFITDQKKPTLTNGSKAAALAELTASTLFQLPGNNPTLFPALKQIFSRLPCLQLNLSPDYGANATLIQQYLGGSYVC